MKNNLRLQQSDLALLQEIETRAHKNKLEGFELSTFGQVQKAYKPHLKQVDFHHAGANNRERLFMAGNQLGKTWAGAFEMAIHLTGLYPNWWRGRRMEQAIRAWAASETSEVTRDGPQRLLIGQPSQREQWGMGAIPYKTLEQTSLRRGVADAIDSILVKHISGGSSSLTFKSYDQGREKWQGQTLDVVWFDEEPDEDIYTEGLTRTNATDGIVYLTFTPLKGMSNVVRSFLKKGV